MRGPGGISLLGEPETTFPLNPNLLLLQSKQDWRAPVSDARKDWFPRLSQRCSLAPLLLQLCK